MGIFSFFNRIPSLGSFSFFKPFMPAKKVSTFVPLTFAATLPFMALPAFGSNFSIFNFNTSPFWGDTFTRSNTSSKQSGGVYYSTKLSSKDSSKYDILIRKYASQYGMEPNFVKAVIKQESQFNPIACGPMTKYGKAKGLMQLIPATAKSYGVIDPYNPEQNIKAGVQLLSNLSKKYNGDKKMILAAYNWGEGNLAKRGFSNRPAETRKYITNVLSYYNEYNHA